MAPFVGGSLNPVMDSVFTLMVVLHSHIGFQYAVQIPAGYINKN